MLKRLLREKREAPRSVESGKWGKGESINQRRKRTDVERGPHELTGSSAEKGSSENDRPEGKWDIASARLKCKPSGTITDL